MSKELYFLRSSEGKIVQDFFKILHPELLPSSELFEKYTAFYGLTRKDLGLYAVVDGHVAGALWARKFQDETSATMMLGVKERYDFSLIGSLMMEQFLLEAATQYEALQVNVSQNPTLQALCEHFGFTAMQEEMMERELERKEIVRPSDGYDPRKWMD